MKEFRYEILCLRLTLGEITTHLCEDDVTAEEETQESENGPGGADARSAMMGILYIPLSLGRKKEKKKYTHTQTYIYM